MASGGDPPTQFSILNNGIFSITPDSSGGGIFELINDSGKSITSFDLSLTLQLPVGDIQAGSSQSIPTITDHALAALNVTVNQDKLVLTPSIHLVPDGSNTYAFESFLFTSLSFAGLASGSCSDPSIANDACLTVNYSNGATVLPNMGTNANPTPGSFFIIDLNNTQSTDYCQNPAGCTDPNTHDHVPYGGLLTTQNDSGPGGFGNVKLGNGQVGFSTPEPAELRFLLGGGFVAGAWFWRRRRFRA